MSAKINHTNNENNKCSNIKNGKISNIPNGNIKNSSNVKRIIIRADGGTKIGFGHLMRCRTIALALRKYSWEAVFLSSIESILKPWPLIDITGEPLTIKDPLQIAQTILPSCISLKQLNTKQYNLNVDIINHVAKEYSSKTILIDHYDYTSNEFLQLKNLGYNLIVIDDIAKRHIISDIIINPNPLVDSQIYTFHDAKLKLCGAKYTLIRPEILKLPRNKEPKENGYILVSFGGTDTSQIYIKLLNQLVHTTAKPIVVTIFPDISKDLLEIWAKSDLSKRALNTNVNAYPDLLQQAEVTISSGGNSLWEIYYVGVPNLLIPIAENQNNAIKVANELKTSFYIQLQKINNESFTSEISEILQKIMNKDLAQEMIKHQQELIDGQGANRVAEEIHKMFG